MENEFENDNELKTILNDLQQELNKACAQAKNDEFTKNVEAFFNDAEWKSARLMMFKGALAKMEGKQKNSKLEPTKNLLESNLKDEIDSAKRGTQIIKFYTNAKDKTQNKIEIEILLASPTKEMLTDIELKYEEVARNVVKLTEMVDMKKRLGLTM